MLIVICGIAITRYRDRAQAATEQAPVEATLVTLTNDQRVANNLEPLAWNANLYRAATQKAADMFEHQYFDHISPSGITPWQFIRQEYRYLEAGENLAIDFQNPVRAIPAWMDSPSHRENILNSNYQDIAIVSTTGTMNGQQTTIIIQMFGQPDFLQ